MSGKNRGPAKDLPDKQTQPPSPLNKSSRTNADNQGTSNIVKCIWKEFSGGCFQKEEPVHKVGVEDTSISNFISVPYQVERLMWYGFLICLDAFLFLFTFFPVRVVLALGHWILRRLRVNTTSLSSSELYEILRGCIFGLSFYALTFIDASVLYHFIRGQAVIKLYVIFNVLEIFDKLCCSFGKDILASLYNAVLMETRSKQAHSDASQDSKSKHRTKLRKLRLGLSMNFLIAALYIYIHSFVLFVKVVTLNAAVNAYNNALLTLLVSNNFVELKSSVFKNFKEENLFEIACSDIAERFQLFIFLAIVTMYNLNNLSWTINMEIVENMVYVIVIVWAMEVLVDWIKHAFITKFNHMNATIYNSFSKIISRDVLVTKQQAPGLSHNITMFMGFVPLPLGILLLRVCTSIAPFAGLLGIAWVFCCWLCLCTLKVLTTIWLLGASVRRIKTPS